MSTSAVAWLQSLRQQAHLHSLHRRDLATSLRHAPAPALRRQRRQLQALVAVRRDHCQSGAGRRRGAALRLPRGQEAAHQVDLSEANGTAALLSSMAELAR
jgi:hypothetical protein